MAALPEFQRLVDEDLMKLKFILKTKIASFEDIKKQEEQLISAIKDIMTQVKEMELVLDKEVQLYKKLAGGWGKAYRERRVKAIGNAIKAELNTFHEEYLKTRNLYDGCISLHQRLQHLVLLLKKMNSENRQGKDKELTLLGIFRQGREAL